MVLVLSACLNGMDAIGVTDRTARENKMPAMQKVFIGLVIAAFASPAFGAGGEGANNPFAGDIGNAIWTVVIFVLVLVVLGKFAWGPILKALQEREDFIHNSLEDARENREASEAKLKEYSDKLQTAREDASAIVEEGRRDAVVLKEKINADAKVEAEALIGRAKREISIATETAVKELYGLSAKIATDAAARIIRKELSPSDHERLVAESIAELGGIGPNGRGGA